ncbi:YciI family protein [Chelativorans salis]|uniref:YciI family protein n=1 Tax=Chelativorans salis TaxID=2978478 RepID=A0ABT2LKL7_9HYPH|nr:YciI family protein [Chelativorans sp. EGI FJ00035]MCT7374919.1 YciI family protein [Chelativorans sp. EGI FJ00035]
MRYVCLVYGDGTAIGALPEDELRQLQRDNMNNDEALAESGHLIVAHALEPLAAATCLRTKGGKIVATDGPYAESKEHLLGFLLIEAKDRNEAVELASTIPMLRHGPVEVREVMTLEGE